jgi:Family of unknown function (DUF5693)
MSMSFRKPGALVLALIALGCVAGLLAARYRLHAESGNKRVEIALEWDEVSRLAQFTHQPVKTVLEQFKHASVTSVVLQEDTFTSLEQSGQVHPVHHIRPNGSTGTEIHNLDSDLFERIKKQLGMRGLYVPSADTETVTPYTRFVAARNPQEPEDTPPASFAVAIDYASLRTIGIGLPPDEVRTVHSAGMEIAGRVGNYPGVNLESARAVLTDLANQGVGIVIFNGEEVLGYRDLEKDVADLFKNGAIPVASEGRTRNGAQASLAYGAVEFGKQKGDEKLSAKLHGDVIRVHSIQTGEMGQLDEVEAVDRFAKAARERNIRFCYVRLFTFAGADPVAENVKYLNAIARAIHKGSTLTGGGLQFGPARRFVETGTPRVLMPLIGLGIAGGFVWMLSLLMPLAPRRQTTIIASTGLLFAGLGMAGDFGPKLLALGAGIIFPAAACLFTFPLVPDAPTAAPAGVKAAIMGAFKAIAIASLITALGIVAVIGLLAQRPYMVHISQYLGIKAQHAVPLFIVTFAALVGGAAAPGEKLARYRLRAKQSLEEALNQNARYGTLIFGLIVLAALMLVIARTGNDAGVGVSGFELKTRAILDRILPVRPRTKEFLVGHPAFVLGICWWLRGRRKLAVPAIAIGSLGQVSLLNTFCHIHTPMIISAWRDVIGLVIGAVIGAAVFAVLEKLMPAPETQQ